MDALKPCPSCQGPAELLPFAVSGDNLWQVTCSQCGMATELEEERRLCIGRWNRRDCEQRLRTWVTALGTFLPVGLTLMFITGALLGSTLFLGAGANP